MPWFWDLVNLSSEVPFCNSSQPNLITQLFNGALHKDLVNLNIHFWLLEPCQSRSNTSLTKCKQELKFLRDAQPEQSEAKWVIRRCKASEVDF